MVYNFVREKYGRNRSVKEGIEVGRMWLEFCGTVTHGDRDEAKYSTEHDDVEVSLIFGTKFSGGPPEILHRWFTK